MKNKKISTVLALTMTILLFCAGGCANEKKEKQVEITLMHGWGGTVKTHKTMTDIYDTFSKEYPSVLMNCVPYATSDLVVEKGNDMLALGKMPDIIATNGLSYYVNNAIEMGEAMDIYPYIESDPEWKEDIAPAVLEAWTTEDNEIYTLPDVLEVAGYWFNEEYFIQAGIVDESGKPVIPHTWDEFLDVVERLECWIDNTDQNISVFALEDVQTVHFLFLARLAGEGENGFEAASNSGIAIEKKTLENTLTDLTFIGQHAKWVDDIENARQCFYTGESAIYFNGVWESDVLKESQLNSVLQYANYPSNSGQSLAYVSPSSGYVLAKQENENIAEAEVRFLKYMLSDEVQTRIAIDTGQASVNTNIDMDRVFKEAPMLGAALEEAYEAEYQIKTIYCTWSQQDIDIVNKYLNQDVWETGKVQEMLEELNKDVQK